MSIFLEHFSIEIVSVLHQISLIFAICWLYGIYKVRKIVQTEQFNFIWIWSQTSSNFAFTLFIAQKKASWMLALLIVNFIAFGAMIVLYLVFLVSFVSAALRTYFNTRFTWVFLLIALPFIGWCQILLFIHFSKSKIMKLDSKLKLDSVSIH